MIRHSLLLLLAAMILTLNAAAQSTAKTAAWTKHDSVRGKFSVLTPCSLSPDTETAPEPGTDAYHSCSAGDGYFVVSYADLPPVPDASLQSVLNALRDGLVTGLKGRLVSEKKIAIGTTPARELLMATKIENADYLYKWRIVIVGGRAFSVGVGTTKAAAASPDVNKYLTSFAAK